jgi:hypothetical protein
MMPNQGAPTPPPDWAITIPALVQDGMNPPCGPVTIRGGLTDPDAAGHQWALLEIIDGTMTTSLRVPWQNADQLGMGIAQILAQVKAQAAAKAGPQLIVPPAGASLPDLNIRKNGHRP